MTNEQSNQVFKISELDKELQKFILKVDTDLTAASTISHITLLNFRFQYINQLLKNEVSTTKQFDHELKHKIRTQQVHIKNVNDALKTKETFGQRIADGIAKFGGSWTFIIAFIFILVTWITLNTLPLFFEPFDKFPYILLNLALSCLAAIQAPIILMSQNRQTERDRVEADNDYEVNVKSEVEIHLLHEKIDYLMESKWQHLTELQQLQIELLQELIKQNQNFLENEKNNK
ncbi:DUF1003 domain-containing protein [Enterococcus hulanensis]|uniref:DUF1003 domain-containing protein n=1 Tax=Enterococcus hulanensis TaxID=2559929 RepID=UPI00289162D6|nr:DUF1003 domain-containing protein [Enterococcus hulanensis]MDT2658731.1 DUF1003 domain-containing protein [Enterococcus hulanensis]